MACRGMLYAITPEQEAELLAVAGKQEVLIEKLNDLWDEDWQVQIDKAWDELHRTLGDGDLEHDVSISLSAAILGGRLLSEKDGLIVVYKDAHLVTDVARASNKFAVREFSERYMARAPTFDIDVDEQMLAGAAFLYCEIRGFYSRAALEGRSVIFAVDQ